MRTILTIFLALLCSKTQGASICSRVARINYQEVLVDNGDTGKGKGLEFYLNKDPVSKELLAEYQNRNRPSFVQAGISTIGSILMLTGVFYTGSENDNSTKNKLILGGAAVLGLNFLVRRTLTLDSENLLDQAVKQYNARNTPKIYFSPFATDSTFGAQAGFRTRF